MILSLAKGIAALIIPVSAGYAVLTFVLRGRRLGSPAVVAMSYGMGMGILAQFMLVIGILGIPYGRVSIGGALFVLTAIFLFLRKKADAPASVRAPRSRRAFFRNAVYVFANAPFSHKALYVVSAGYMLYVVLFVLWRALDIPVYTYDAIVIIAAKAKVLFYERALAPVFNVHHPFYPLQIPFSASWVAIAVGEWDGQLMKIIFPGFFLSFLVIYIDILRRYATVFWTAVGVLLLCSSNFLLYHATISYRDMALLYYNCVVIILLLRWSSSGDDVFLLAAGLFAGFGTFTKLEGSLFMAIYTALIVVIYARDRAMLFKRKAAGYLKFAVPSFGMLAFYSSYRVISGIPPPADKRGVEIGVAVLDRIPHLARAFWNDLFLLGAWNILWALLALSVILNLKRIRERPQAGFILLAMVLFLGAYFGLGLFTPSFRYIGGISATAAMSRLILHFSPLAPMAIVFLNTPCIPEGPGQTS